MKFTIDTSTDSYEDAIRTVRAAYGNLEKPLAGRPMALPHDVVWTDPRRHKATSWTEGKLRSWVAALTTVEELDVVWRVCAQPGPPGVRSQVIAEYLSPQLTGKPAVDVLGVVMRRMNRAARELDAAESPFVIHEGKRTRTVDCAVAAILIDALAAHPLWPRMRHHTSS